MNFLNKFSNLSTKSHNFKRGEIATILTLGTLAVMIGGILIGQRIIGTQKNQDTTTKAATNPYCVPGSFKINGTAAPFYADTNIPLTITTSINSGDQPITALSDGYGELAIYNLDNLWSANNPKPAYPVPVSTDPKAITTGTSVGSDGVTYHLAKYTLTSVSQTAAKEKTYTWNINSSDFWKADQNFGNTQIKSIQFVAFAGTYPVDQLENCVGYLYKNSINPTLIPVNTPTIVPIYTPTVIPVPPSATPSPTPTISWSNVNFSVAIPKVGQDIDFKPIYNSTTDNPTPLPGGGGYITADHPCTPATTRLTPSNTPQTISLVCKQSSTGVTRYSFAGYYLSAPTVAGVQAFYASSTPISTTISVTASLINVSPSPIPSVTPTVSYTRSIQVNVNNAPSGSKFEVLTQWISPPGASDILCSQQNIDSAQYALTVKCNLIDGSGTYKIILNILNSSGTIIATASQNLDVPGNGQGLTLSYSFNAPSVTSIPALTATPSPTKVPPPTNLQPVGSVAPGTVHFTWNAVNDPRVTGYWIYIHDTMNPYPTSPGNVCTALYAGDYCTYPNPVITTNYFDYSNLQQGHTYEWWLATAGGPGGGSVGSAKQTITVQSVCLKKNLGDANCDTFVDGLDYSKWLNTQCHPGAGQSCADYSADFNGDRNIDDLDLEIWKVNRAQ